MDAVKLEEWEKSHSKIIESRNLNTPDEKIAEFHCYRNEKGVCYIPCEHIKGALINAGTYIKSKVGSKSKSMQLIVAATFRLNDQLIPLPNWDAVDKRSAVNKVVKARIITIRPKWTKWETTFEMDVLEESIHKDMVRQLLEYAGTYVGIGSYTPIHKGEFGLFDAKIISMNGK